MCSDYDTDSAEIEKMADSTDEDGDTEIATMLCDRQSQENDLSERITDDDGIHYNVYFCNVPNIAKVDIIMNAIIIQLA